MPNVQLENKNKPEIVLFLWFGSCHLSSSPLEDLGDYVNILSSTGSLIFKIVNDFLKFCLFLH